MIKKNWIYLLFVGCLIIFVIKKYYFDKQKNKGLTLQVEKRVNGWIYQVKQNDTVLINQENIPGLPGNKGFDTKEQAECVGNKVIQKIKTSKNFPIITPLDLDSCNVK